MRWIAYRDGPLLVQPLQLDDLRSMGYFSQEGQDYMLDRHIFSGKRDGVFIDVGAHDGVSFSNSCFLERERGWSGICIEANPEIFEKCQAQRSSVCANVAISDRSGSADFLVVGDGRTMLSGLTASFDRRHLGHIARAAPHGAGSRVLTVEKSRLDDILREVGIHHVDLLLIDVEGGELGVLDSIRLEDFGRPIVLLENSYHGYSIARRLRRQNYRLLLRIARDEIYVPVGENGMASACRGVGSLQKTGLDD